MRSTRGTGAVLALLAAFALLGAAAVDEDDPDDDGSDLDLEDLDDGPEAGDAGMGMGAPPNMDPVEDFDLGMPEEDRRKRMSACYIHVMNRVQHHREQLQNLVKEVMAQHKEKMTQEQALNTIVFSWMMSCYMNIEPEEMKEAVLGKEPSPQLEQSLFMPREDKPQQVPQASQRQWQLLEKVLTENQKEMMKQQQEKQRQEQQSRKKPEAEKPGAGAGPGPGGPSFGAGGPLASGMSDRTKVIYTLVVFVVIFGLSALVVLRLIRSEQASRERPNKRQKEKGEKKSSRKHQ